MQSILVASRDKEKALEFAKKISRDNKIHKLDLAIIETDTLGIDDVRNFQKKAVLKPFKSLKKIVFLNAKQLTPESQNALLKILEEPPDNTIIILHVPDKYSVLPTILSRCNVFELGKVSEFSKNDISKHLNFLVSFPKRGVGDRLKIAQDISKDKEEALMHLEKLIIGARDLLIKNAENKDQLSEYYDILISLQRGYTIIKTTNVNLRLALENLFLNL